MGEGRLNSDNPTGVPPAKKETDGNRTSPAELPKQWPQTPPQWRPANEPRWRPAKPQPKQGDRERATQPYLPGSTKRAFQVDQDQRTSPYRSVYDTRVPSKAERNAQTLSDGHELQLTLDGLETEISSLAESIRATEKMLNNPRQEQNGLDPSELSGQHWTSWAINCARQEVLATRARYLADLSRRGPNGEPSVTELLDTARKNLLNGQKEQAIEAYTRALDANSRLFSRRTMISSAEAILPLEARQWIYLYARNESFQALPREQQEQIIRFVTLGDPRTAEGARAVLAQHPWVRTLAASRDPDAHTVVEGLTDYLMRYGPTQRAQLLSITFHENFAALSETHKRDVCRLVRKLGNNSLTDLYGLLDQQTKFGPGGKRSSVLAAKGFLGDKTLVQYLCELPLDAHLTSEFLAELNRPGEIGQGNQPHCVAALADKQTTPFCPAERARLYHGLLYNGSVRMKNGDLLQMDPRERGLRAPDSSGRTNSERILHTALMKYMRDKEYIIHYDKGTEHEKITPHPGQLGASDVQVAALYGALYNSYPVIYRQNGDILAYTGLKDGKHQFDHIEHNGERSVLGTTNDALLRHLRNPTGSVDPSSPQLVPKQIMVGLDWFVQIQGGRVQATNHAVGIKRVGTLRIDEQAASNGHRYYLLEQKWLGEKTSLQQPLPRHLGDWMWLPERGTYARERDVVEFVNPWGASDHPQYHSNPPVVLFNGAEGTYLKQRDAFEKDTKYFVVTFSREGQSRELGTMVPQLTGKSHAEYMRDSAFRVYTYKPPHPSQ